MSAVTTMNDPRGNATETTPSQKLRAKKILVVYENQPLTTQSKRAVPRLLAQLAEHLAQFDSSTEVIAVSPGKSEIEGVASHQASLAFPARARCRVANSRLTRWARSWRGVESTIPYQIARSGLQAFADSADDQTIVITATMSVAIQARQLLPKSRIVYWVQGMPRLGQESLASRAVAASDAIVAPSRAIYNDLFQLVCRDRFPPPVWVIPNTIDQSQFKTESADVIAAVRKRIGLAEDDVAVMHVGRAPEKGLQIAKAALALGQFQKNTVLVTIGGQKKERGRIHDSAEYIQLGWINPEELNQVYQACSLGLVPSVWWENCPLALIEMMSLGLCPIGARTGGIPEMIEHGKTGLIIDAPNDVHAWAGAIESLLSNDPLRESLAGEAKRSVQRRFDRRQLMAQWQQVLNIVIQSA